MTWRQTRVSADRTHHTLDGRPLYGTRFQEVLKFHAPGLAPAMDASGAMHIDTTGCPAYRARFQRTFGFYEGRAAVQTPSGWFHITPDGNALYLKRFEWCGNYQSGRCPVRDANGRYRHLLPDGTEAYDRDWCYAGDFRDGLAVVQRDDGLHSHIDTAGRLVHARWFVDLDVFHKGFARARDDAGWTHVDEIGSACYERRFAMVEPFYNGQARVETFDGGLEVIDERGRRLRTLRAPRTSDFAALSADLVGFWRTETIAAAVTLGIPDALPASLSQLATRRSLHTKRLGALLRGLRELGLVARDGETWQLTERGSFLRRDHPLTLADAALEYAGPLGALWSQLPDALRDAGWSPPDVFGDVARDDARVAPHHRMLQSYARHDYPAVADSLPLTGVTTLLDVAGGTGAMAHLLVKRHPDLEVKILERPEVATQVLPHPRVTPIVGDIFEPWSVEAEAAILSRVLHDWDDEEAVTILRHAKDNLASGSHVFVVEMLLSDDGAFGGLCDLHLLMATGGRERTLTEYRALLARAGLVFERCITLAALPNVIVGVVP